MSAGPLGPNWFQSWLVTLSCAPPQLGPHTGLLGPVEPLPNWPRLDGHEARRGQRIQRVHQKKPSSVVLFLGVSVGPDCPIRTLRATGLVPVLRSLLVVSSELMSASAEDSPLELQQVGCSLHSGTSSWALSVSCLAGTGTGWGGRSRLERSQVCEGSRYQCCCSRSIQTGTSRASLMLHTYKNTRLLDN